MTKKSIYCKGHEVVSNVNFNPQTPQGGLYKLLSFSKSPLGDLGVDLRKQTFETTSTQNSPRNYIVTI
jgi:hypothetical protein